jgi:membrane protease YdiL (CAAX protease family)
MTEPAEAPTRHRGLVIVAVLAVLAVLAVANVAENQVLAGWVYVPLNLAVAGVVVLLGRRVMSLQEMGFANWRSGAVWGGVQFAVISVMLSVAILVPVFDELFRNRNAGESTLQWFYIAFIRIPLGTVLLEEVAFRGVLPALFARKGTVIGSSILASMWFALWRVLPEVHGSHGANTAERWLGQGVVGTTAGVIWVLAGTFFGGLFWCFVRYRSGSLLSSFLGHLATTSMAYTIAFAVSR